MTRMKSSLVMLSSSNDSKKGTSEISSFHLQKLYIFRVREKWRKNALEETNQNANRN